MKIAICDDEKEIRNNLCEIIVNEFPDVDVMSYCCGEELLSCGINDDIVFLDIQMPGMDGMRAAKELRSKNKDMIIIFVTVMEEYVFKAFDVGAFNYLVKPFSKERFVEVLKKAIEERSVKAVERDCRRILVKTKDGHMKINVNEIIYAEVYNRKIIIHKSNEDIEYYGRLSELEKQAGEGFFRCHRAYLVNMDYVVKYNSSTIYLEKGQAIMAKKNYPDFVKAFLKYNQIKGKGQ